MKREHDSLERQSGIPENPERAAKMMSVLVGAILGLGIGFFSAAGALAVIIGGVVGALAGFLVAQLSRKRWERQRVVDTRLDREIGVIDGDIGSRPSAPSNATT